MRKLLTLMMVLILCFGVVGCNNNKKTDEKEKEEKEVTISDYSWQDCVISIDGNIIEFPISVEKLTEMGFTNFHCNFKQVEPGRTVHGTAVYKGGRYQLEIRNPKNENGEKSEMLEPEKCEVAGIRVHDIISLGSGKIQIVFPKNIIITETTIEDIIEKYGKQTEKHGENTYVWSKNGVIMEISLNKDGHGMVEGFYISNQ